MSAPCASSSLQSDASDFYCGDALATLKTLKPQSVHLIVSSPPYNIGKSYERDEDKKTLDDYLKWMGELAKEFARVCDDRGAICWQVGNYITEKKEVLPLDVYFVPIFRAHGFLLRNRIVWTFGHGLHSTQRLSGRYEVLLWFTRSSQYTFNLDDIRVPSKEPGKRAYKGANKGKLSGHPLGKNPSDVWTVMRQEWAEGVWQFPNVKNNHCEKDTQTKHPCQFPVELAERCVLAFSNEGDTVCDPFCGLGTVAVACALHGRSSVNIDKESHYIERAKQRLESFQQGTLEWRQIGTPIAQASSSCRTRKYPAEWSAILESHLKKPRLEAKR